MLAGWAICDRGRNAEKVGSQERLRRRNPVGEWFHEIFNELWILQIERMPGGRGSVSLRGDQPGLMLRAQLLSGCCRVDRVFLPRGSAS